MVAKFQFTDLKYYSDVSIIQNNTCELTKFVKASMECFLCLELYHSSLKMWNSKECGTLLFF